MATMIERRREAGKRYAAAVDELKAAYVDLAAYDALQPQGSPSFGGTFPVAIQFFHAEFASDDPGHWQSLIAPRIEEINRG